MCLSCGCGKPNDDHGDKRHITMTQLEQAAKASNTTPEQVARNISDGVRMSGMGGMQGSRQQEQRPQN